jgi:hypothetical protein
MVPNVAVPLVPAAPGSNATPPITPEPSQVPHSALNSGCFSFTTAVTFAAVRSTVKTKSFPPPPLFTPMYMLLKALQCVVCPGATAPPPTAAVTSATNTGALPLHSTTLHADPELERVYAWPVE